jgi:hypothetical protein
MAGGAPQTGLELLLQVRDSGAPGVVFVELNETIIRGTDASLLSELVGNTLFEARKALPMLQTRFRPVSLVLRAGENLIAGHGPSSDSATAAPGRPSAGDEALREIAVSRALSGQMRPLPADTEARIRSESRVVRDQIARLEARGWRVILCDVPRDSKLAKTPQEVHEHELFMELFPEDRYRWLPSPTEGNWVTRDGAHLIHADARRFAVYLRDYVERVVGAAQADPR